jgi:hypothetical protein
MSEARAQGEWLVACSCGWRIVTSPFQRARAIGYVHETRAREGTDVLLPGEMYEARHSCRLARVPASE